MMPFFFLQDIVTFYVIISLSHNLFSEKMSFGKYGGERAAAPFGISNFCDRFNPLFYINTRACLFLYG